MGLVKFVICTSEYMTFYLLTKGYKVPGNQGTHDTLNLIRNNYLVLKFTFDTLEDIMRVDVSIEGDTRIS